MDKQPMTNKEVEDILLYHGRGTFSNDYRDRKELIEECRAKNADISSFCLSLCIPSNRNVVSGVEVNVMSNLTIESIEIAVNELQRFIQRLDRTINSLTDDERIVVKNRYLDNLTKPRTFEELEPLTNISVRWMKVLNNQALTKVRIAIDNNIFFYRFE